MGKNGEGVDGRAEFTCRPGCGACCIALSISSPIPASPGRTGLPGGKPAGLTCPQLTDDFLCALFGSPERPAVCAALRPLPEMCGESRQEALAYLADLEERTKPY
jgi:hypothetical protein